MEGADEKKFKDNIEKKITTHGCMDAILQY